MRSNHTVTEQISRLHGVTRHIQDTVDHLKHAARLGADRGHGQVPAAEVATSAAVLGEAIGEVELRLNLPTAAIEIRDLDRDGQGIAA